MSISRRALLSGLGACALGEGLGGCVSQTGPRGVLPRRWVDLTHTLSPGFPYIPVQNKTFPFRLTPIATLLHDGVYANRWELTEHVGTHLDAPCHFAEGGLSVDQIPIERLIAPLVVLNIRTRAELDPDTSLTVADLALWETRFGRIPDQAALFLNSGWSERARDAPRFVNRDATGTLHSPGFSERLIEFLLQHRQIVGIGVDTLSIDPGPLVTYPAHKRLFAAGKWAVECVANLDQVPESGASVLVAPVKVQSASGAPARVLAFW